jgi:hypothetical protein
MGNYGDDRHGGGDRWRGHREGYDRDYRGGGERGFIDRAGDEVRSWFGDDDAQRRREADQRRWEQEQRMSGRRDNDSRWGDSGPGTFGGGGFGTGWGNQGGNSWNRERPGERGGYGGATERARGLVLELSAATGAGAAGVERLRLVHRLRRRRRASTGRRRLPAGGSGGPGGDYQDHPRRPGRRHHDPHYSEWRRRQIEDLDRDYDEYRREHQSKFETEFGSWRSKRQGQRQSLGRVTEHMEVVGSDGSHVGTVDKVRGDRIILTKSDSGAGGMHHSVPCSLGRERRGQGHSQQERRRGDGRVAQRGEEPSPVRARRGWARRAPATSTARSPAPTSNREGKRDE